MRLGFDWDTYRDIFNMPVEGMSVINDLNNYCVNRYVDDGNLFTPEWWRYIQLKRIQVHYVEINGFARVFSSSFEDPVKNHLIDRWVTHVREISGTKETPEQPKGKLISTYSFEKYGYYYDLESGANFFISQRHPNKETRGKALANTHYLNYLENELGVKTHMMKFPNELH